ncbi:unnamed protein product, partial [Musa textilis]
DPCEENGRQDSTLVAESTDRDRSFPDRAGAAPELGGVDPISAACLPLLEVEVSVTEALSSLGLRLSSSVMLAVAGVKNFKLRCRLASGTVVHDCNEMRSTAKWHFRESWSPTRAGSVNSCTARVRDTFHA